MDRFKDSQTVALAIDLPAREGGTATHGRDGVPGLLTGAGLDRHVDNLLPI